MRDSYIFTIITAAYNVEPYLDECVQSLLNQDIGFKKHVQLILVDDGSTDGTPALCDKYAAEYPENILVIHQENAGASAARNTGLDHAKGRYLNFLDADDKLSHNTLSNVYRFFAANEADTDVVAIPMHMFDAVRGPHSLNGKFRQGTRLANLLCDPKIIHMSFPGSFVKRTAMEGHRFDSRMTIAEDTVVLHSVLLNRPKLGLVANAAYYYRKRQDQSSSTQNGTFNKGFYLPYMKHFILKLLKDAEEKYGTVPEYLQESLMFDMQMRFKVNPENIGDTLTDEEVEEWKDCMYEALRHINADVILSQRQLRVPHKLFLLEKKGVPITFDKASWGYFSIFAGTRVVHRFKDTHVVMERLECADGKTVTIRACCVLPTCVDINQCTLRLLINGTVQQGTCEQTLYTRGHKVHGIPCENKLELCASIPLDKMSGSFEARIELSVYNHNLYLFAFDYGAFFPLTKRFGNSYCIVGDYIVRASSTGLVFKHYSKRRHLRNELRFMRNILKSRYAGAFYAVVLRALYWLTKPCIKKDIWLISDRVNRADDNGEAFFRFLTENKLHPNSYFVIGNGCPDYERMKKYGKVIPLLSLKHLLYYLHAEKILSSLTGEHVDGFPKPRRSWFFGDLTSNKYCVFLQHGIIMNDVSNSIGGHTRRISLFVTSTQGEYESIALNPKYQYGPDIVKLTGLPRYDYLENAPENAIYVAPTWRNWLASIGNYYTSGHFDMNVATYKESDYAKFFHGLLGSERLHSVLKEYGYKLYYLPHPCMTEIVDRIEWPEHVEVLDTNNLSYKDVFRKGKLMVTDYSSCVMDFAYLRKPVIYCQFDKDVFFGRHYRKGYFDYERDGFGEVECDLESSIDRIIEYVRNGCTMKPQYIERAERFFAFHDRKNCQRVYDEIIGHGSEN